MGGHSCLISVLIKYCTYHLTALKYMRRSGWNSGGRMVIAEGESVPSVVGVWGGVSPPQPTKGYGEYRRKRTLAYFEGHRMLLFVPMTKSGGAICISVPHSKFWGACPPVIYSNAIKACSTTVCARCLALHTWSSSYLCLTLFMVSISSPQWQVTIASTRRQQVAFVYELRGWTRAMPPEFCLTSRLPKFLVC